VERPLRARLRDYAEPGLCATAFPEGGSAGSDPRFKVRVNRQPHYLMKESDLRLVERFETKIPWGASFRPQGGAWREWRVRRV